jgi:hypothetical protein
MTKLKKPVRRETAALYIKRPLIIQLEPPNLIGIKEKGRRKFFYTTVERIYKLAVQDHVNRQRQEAKKKRKKKDEEKTRA